jgi:flagellar biogenesis protein FliO
MGLLASAKAATASTLPDVNIAHSLIQMVLALGVVVACIWGLSKVLARVKSGPKAKGPASKRRADPSGLQIISRQTLGKDLAIATVRWGEREVLVGIAGSTITFLNEPASDRPVEQPRREPAAFAEAIRENSARVDEAILAERGEAFAASAPRPRESVMSGARAGGRASSSSTSLIETLRNATIRR